MVSCTLLVHFFACSNKDTAKEKELELREREVKLKEEDLKRKEEDLNNYPVDALKKAEQTTSEPILIKDNIGSKKYIYVVIKTEEPRLYHLDPGLTYVDSEGLKTIPGFNSVDWKKFTYQSDIFEIINYTESEQYKYMDTFENKIYNGFNESNSDFKREVFFKVKSQDEQNKLLQEVSKILDRKCYVFETYKDASIHRNNNKSKF
jgi:hypothetical protein